MKIGIDIDGVILNSENEFRIYAELYDLLELHKDGVINKLGIIQSDRYNWNEEESKNFMEKYAYEAIKKANLMPGADEVLKLLKKDGHELILITARGMEGHGGEIMKKPAIEKFKECGIEFDKYYWGVEDKAEVGKKENIDIMIDDRYTICEQMANNKIKGLYFRDIGRKKLQENSYLKEIHNWGEIYRYIYKMEEINAK